jgi:hypothetical protein
VYSAITAIAATAMSLQAVSAAPVSTIDPRSADLVSGAPYTPEAYSVIESSRPAVESLKQSELVPSEELLPTGSVAGWFVGGGAELGFWDDKSALQIDPAACLYLDSYLHSGRSGKGDCRVLTPGDDSEILTLPYLALSAWAPPAHTTFTAGTGPGGGCTSCAGAASHHPSPAGASRSRAGRGG